MTGATRPWSEYGAAPPHVQAAASPLDARGQRTRSLQRSRILNWLGRQGHQAVSHVYPRHFVVLLISLPN